MVNRELVWRSNREGGTNRRVNIEANEIYHCVN